MIRHLRLDRPAEHWLEAFPVGDGQLGALVFGGTSVETLSLNLDTFWSGVARDTTDASRRDAYARVRQLLLDGDNAGAEEASRAMQGPETESYQPVADLILRIHDDSECVSYDRVLDMERGVVTTSFTLASGLEVTRTVRVRDGGIEVVTATNRPAEQTRELTSPHPMQDNVVEAPAHVVGLMTGLTGFVSDEPVVYGGGMTVPVDITERDDTVRITMGPSTRTGPAHDVLLRRASVDLGEANEWASELFDFGRYLLVSSSMPGTQPATLQGIWNVHRRPPWNSNYTININTEMNYWSANPAHLPECNEALFALLDDLARTGAHVAEVDYGAPGWVAHHNTDFWRHATAVGEGRSPSHWSAWPFGGVWLARHCWEHWRYTGDDAFWHDRALPVLRGAADFVKATLVELPDGTLLTGPSTSPENNYAPDASIALGVTCDRVLARELFTIVGDHETAARIPGEAVGGHGQIMEWFEDLDDPADDHRHTSHLVGLYPGNSIDLDRTPALAAAARRTLDQRGPGAQGWAILWRACLWARLRDGDRAWALLERLNVACPVEPPFGPVGGRYPNSFLAHPPFQIDANLGFPAAVIELLVQSHAGYLHLLPALPAALPNGEIRGVLTHGGHEVNLRWSDGSLAEVEIGTGHEPLHLRIADGPITYDVADPDDVIRIRA
jgi:alpha-L-fucosidase 2